MGFEEYLKKTLSACWHSNNKEEEDEDIQEFLELLKSGQQILIMGKERTGKTTLVRVLRNRGYNVIEPDEMPRVYLTKQIPFEDMITDFYQSIE